VSAAAASQRLRLLLCKHAVLPFAQASLLRQQANGAGPPLQVCIASGRIIRDVPTLRCKVCRHSMAAAEVRARAACPLCHSDLYSSSGAAPAAASLRCSSTSGGSGSRRSTAARQGHSMSSGSSRGAHGSVD
jgi:hypothetical protein